MRRLQRLAVAVLALLLAGLALSPARPQSVDPTAGSFLTPFPENDTWRAMVVGDSLAEGLLPGLLEALVGETRFQLQRKHRPLGALTRVDVEEDLRSFTEQMSKDTSHVVIITLGAGDRAGVRLPNGRRHAVGTDEWRQLYAARVDRVMRAARRKSTAVYWIGLPIQRRPEWNDDVEVMNQLYRERAGANGVRFIDVYTESADEGGNYNDWGPDITGKSRRLREADGVHFTAAGYRKLAHFVEQVLKRDMAQARNERTVPLAGADDEQRKLVPTAAVLAPNAASPAGTAAQPSSPVAKSILKGPTPAQRSALATPQPQLPPAAGGAGDQRAETARVTFRMTGAGGREEQVSIDIVRPAISASVIALVTRRETGDKPSQVGDTLTDTLSNGLMVMRSVTPSAEARGQKAAPSQQPHFRALVKGERLPWKPGRADDHRWPREDDLPPPPTLAPGAKTPFSAPAELRQPPKGAPKVPGRS